MTSSSPSSSEMNIVRAKKRFAQTVKEQLRTLLESGTERKTAVDMILVRIGMNMEDEQQQQQEVDENHHHTNKLSSVVDEKELNNIMKRHALTEEHARRALVVKAELQVRTFVS